MRAWIAAAALVAAGSLLSVPPGFRKKQRGKHVVYCRKETAMGTRMEREKCYDEEGLREMEMALREEREKIDQMRRVCSTMQYCGSS